MADYSDNQNVSGLDAVSSPLESSTRVLCQDPGDTDKLVYTTPADIAEAVYGTDDNAFTTAEQTKLSDIEASADVTDAVNIAAAIAGATSKSTPVDADGIGIIDSADSSSLKIVTIAELKAVLKTYFDTLYAAI